MFVLDEINLAEDAVIERLNSVLESGSGHINTSCLKYTLLIHVPVSHPVNTPSQPSFLSTHTREGNNTGGTGGSII